VVYSLLCDVYVKNEKEEIRRQGRVFQEKMGEHVFL
jgi:hypothetical protein